MPGELNQTGFLTRRTGSRRPKPADDRANLIEAIPLLGGGIRQSNELKNGRAWYCRVLADLKPHFKEGDGVNATREPARFTVAKL